MSKLLNGAEAILHFSDDSVRKERVAKSYRHPSIDQTLRAKRNRKEAKILAQAPVRVPKLISADEFSITMERINGQRLRDALNPPNAAQFGEALGTMIKELHAADIIHGDLTTSNVMVDQDHALVLIDFGLSQNSKKREDKAVDLHILRETLQATHAQEKELFWQAFVTAYADKNVLDTLVAVEKRGRYKRKD